MKLYYFIK